MCQAGCASSAARERRWGVQRMPAGVGAERLGRCGRAEQVPLADLAPHAPSSSRTARASRCPRPPSSRRSARARLTIASTIAVLSLREPTPAMNERSIFSASTGQAFEVRERGVAGAEVVDREVEAERAERTERAQRRLGVAHERALGDLQPQRRRLDAARRAARAPRRSAARAPRAGAARGSRSSRAAEHRARPRATRTAWRHACSSAHTPSGTMRPVSSASGTNSIGATRPRSGCSQRISASKPTSVPWSRSIIGW